MADPEHIQWLLEGVDAWNARRESCHFVPDLKDVNLRWKNLTGADLSFAHLEGANLSRVRLEGAESSLLNARLEGAILDNSLFKGANLALANLSNARLYKADLRGADLTNARLEGAYMNFAKLEGANLDSARLNNAKLEHATVDRANFLGAIMSGADLQKVELWKAVIYPEDESPTRYEMEKPTVESVGDLLGIIRRIVKFYENSSGQVSIYFRGEPSTEWSLTPSVLRKDFDGPEGEMLVELISRRPEEFNGLNSALSQWVLAQHHGLKTRFLDISQDPLVALFYACGGLEGKGNAWEKKPGRLYIFAVPRYLVKPFNSNTISIIANFAKLSRYEQDLLLGKSGVTYQDSFDSTRYSERLMHPQAMERLYQLIRQEKPSFAGRINPRDFYKVFVVEPQQFPERLRVQSGAFLVSAFHERFERSEVRSWNCRIPIYVDYEFTVPGNRKAAILDELRLLKVTKETLFPGLDESAKAIMSHYNSGGG